MYSENKILNIIKALLFLVLATGFVFPVISGDAVIENCEISDNTATGKGGGLYLKTTSVQVKNCTVVNNSSDISGGGAAFELGKNPLLVNMIFWENIAPSAKEIYNPTAYIFNSDIQQDGFNGVNGNINQNPFFIDSSNYKLQSSSPVINAGDVQRAPYYDKNGARRGSTVDMGAYEYDVNSRILYVDDTNGSDAYDGLASVYDSGTGRGPKKTIQAAINVAETGDTVNVAAGTYTGAGNKNLDFKGKDIKLIGAGAVNTIIDCENSGRAFYFHCNETNNAQVKGFKIQNGSVSGSSPDGCGGAILAENASPSIKNCITQSNTAEWGGAIEFCNSNSLLENCLVTGNTANKTGGSLYILGSSTVNIVNCTIADNTEVGGEEQSSITNSRVKVNIINTITERLHVIRYSPSNVSVEYSCIKDGFSGTGNITWDTSTVLFDSSYKLNPFSSAIDSANASKSPETDILGNSRYDSPLAANGTASGTPPVDMGAYEFTASQVSSTSCTLTLATDETSSVSYTITNTLQSTQISSGTTVSGTPSTASIPIGIYRIDYTVSGSSYQRTVYFNSDMTIYLNPNEKEIDLGEITSYKRYELRFVHHPFGLTESGNAYEDEIADITTSSVTLTKTDESTRTVAIHQYGNVSLSRMEYLGTTSIPDSSGVLCEDLIIKDASLPDNTIIFDMYYDDVSASALVPSGGLEGTESEGGMDTFERFQVNVNHLIPGVTDNFYLKETDSAVFSTESSSAAVTAGANSGGTSRTENLSTFTGLTIAGFDPSTVTASASSADSSNLIPVNVNYSVSAEALLPLSSDLASGYGAADPSRISEETYDGDAIDTYKRYMFKLNYALMGEDAFDSFYVVENDVVGLSATPAQATITRDSTLIATETLSNFPDSDKMAFAQFTPSNTITANDSNADNANIIAAAVFIAEAEVLVPSLSGQADGYGGGDPSKVEDSTYIGDSLDTYKRYNAVVSYTDISYSGTDNFYVSEEDVISLSEGSATVTGVYPGTYSLYAPAGFDFQGFTPAGPITADDSSANTSNIIPISCSYQTATYVAIPLSSMETGCGGSDPAATEENYTGSVLDTYMRYKTVVDYSYFGDSTPDNFYVSEGDVMTFREGIAEVASDVNSFNATLKTFTNEELMVFEPSGTITASSTVANTNNQIDVSAWGAVSEVAVVLPSSTSPSAAGDPEASGQSMSDGGLYLDTRERYRTNINYTKQIIDKTESVYAMEGDTVSVTLNPMQVAAAGLNPASLTLSPFSGWTVNSYTKGATTGTEISFIASVSDADAGNNIDIAANYSLSGTADDWASEIALPPVSDSAEGYGAVNPDTEPENSNLDTWKRFVYDLEIVPFTYHSNVAKIKLKWQKKVVVSANHEKVEQIIVRSKTGGNGISSGLIGTVNFPDRVSEGQELSGNAVVVHVGDLIYGGYDYVSSTLPADSLTYQYRVYTRLTDASLSTVIFMEDEVFFSSSGMEIYLDSDNDGLTDTEETQSGTSSASSDSDGDGLSDYDEIKVYHTDPLKADTDGDGLTDYEEISVYHTDPLKEDTDGDWLYDGEEINTYNTDPLKSDTDGDGLTDYEETIWFQTNPNKVDSDSDGLNDLDEILTYHTDPMNTDTDSDGLPDAYEVNKTSTDPANPDSDNDGISDGNEDNDSDGISNADEYKAGMNPGQAAITGDGYQYDQTILEDAEDTLTTGWEITVDDGASVANVVDPDNSSNRAIQFSESGSTSEYTFTPSSAIPEGQLKIEWRMRYSSDYDICVKCTTSGGTRYIHYTSAASNNLGAGENIYFGLGAGGGVWKTVRRDLTADLQAAQSSNTILSVDAIIVKGSGYLDDIRTLAYIDSDRDLMPDNIELAMGLDPNNAADAAWDSDSDGITNFNEFMSGTLKRTDNDRDGDGIADTLDANPDSAADSDSDGLPDDWENYYFGDLDETAAGDTDSDSMTNIDEYRLGRHPNAAVIDDTDDSLELRVYNP